MGSGKSAALIFGSIENETEPWLPSVLVAIAPAGMVISAPLVVLIVPPFVELNNSTIPVSEVSLGEADSGHP